MSTKENKYVHGQALFTQEEYVALKYFQVTLTLDLGYRPNLKRTCGIAILKFFNIKKREQERKTEARKKKQSSLK